MRIKVNRGGAEDGGFLIADRIHVTGREIRALIMVGLGFCNREGAEKLGITEATFRNHVYNVMRKLGGKNRAHAIALAVERGMIEIQGDEDIFHDEEREEAGEYKDRYLLCIICGRASLESEFQEQEPRETIINHVPCEIPEYPKCPHEGCKGNVMDTIDWSVVRYHRRDYPEKPQLGVVYDYDLEWYLSGENPRIRGTSQR